MFICVCFIVYSVYDLDIKKINKTTTVMMILTIKRTGSLSIRKYHASDFDWSVEGGESALAEGQMNVRDLTFVWTWQSLQDSCRMSRDWIPNYLQVMSIVVIRVTW